ncbi:MAG: HAD family hydrolase [Thermodesulfobacteriota bacterium]
MVKIISFDMDGTLIDPEFTDWVWSHGIPTLYAKKEGIGFLEAKSMVEEEYRKVGEGAIEWYDIKYWLNFFGLNPDWKALMEPYIDKIKVYSDVNHVLDRLKERNSLILTSNAGKEFIDIELRATGIGKYFDRIFSATSDFGQVKKTIHFYQTVCEILKVSPGEIVHVGDHYEFDYLVPRSLGIHAFYLDRSEKQKGEFILSNLKELERKVERVGLMR